VKYIQDYKFAMVRAYTSMVDNPPCFVVIDMDMIRVVNAYQKIFRDLRNKCYEPYCIQEFDSRFAVVEDMPLPSRGFATATAFIGDASDLPDWQPDDAVIANMEQMKAVAAEQDIRMNLQILEVFSGKFGVRGTLRHGDIDVVSKPVKIDKLYPSIADELAKRDGEERMEELLRW
jgi:hypothetical protein